MRTTLDIDDTLLEALRERLPDKSKTEAIETAIRAYLERESIEGLRRIAGSFEIEDLTAELRRDRKL